MSVCLHVNMCIMCSRRTKDIRCSGTAGTHCCDTMWVLGTELGSSVRAANVLNHRVLGSSYSLFCFSFIYFSFMCMDVCPHLCLYHVCAVPREGVRSLGTRVRVSAGSPVGRNLWQCCLTHWAFSPAHRDPFLSLILRLVGFLFHIICWVLR